MRLRREKKTAHQTFEIEMPDGFAEFLHEAGYRLIKVDFIGSQIVFSWEER